MYMCVCECISEQDEGSQELKIQLLFTLQCYHNGPYSAKCCTSQG